MKDILGVLVSAGMPPKKVAVVGFSKGGAMVSRARASTATVAALLLVTASCAAQRPPVEKGPFRNPELVELIRMDSTLKLDIRYATHDNFLGRAVYREARAFLQRPAAEALVRVNTSLRPQGYGLVIFDGYRPWSVTKVFWEATPEGKKQFVADPREGSKHNRGCAVDLSLIDLTSGGEVSMPSEYDEMSERAHTRYTGGTEESRRLRDLLRRAMEAEGFEPYEPEWWHYNYKDWQNYPILDIPFEVIGATS